MRRLAVPTLLLSVAFAAAQRPSPPPPPKPGIGRPIPIPQAPPEEQVPDYRAWLEGMKAKGKQKDIDPKLLQELMSKLPKDQKTDPSAIEKLLKENEKFKDPAFLKQLEQMMKSSDFPKNLEGSLGQPGDPPKLGNADVLKGQLKDVLDKGGQKAPGSGLPEGPQAGIDPNKGADTPLGKWVAENFGNSPATEQAMKDLLGELSNPGNKGMFDDVPELKDANWNDIGQWGKDSGWDFKMSDGGGQLQSTSLGGTGGGGSSSSGGSSFPSGGGGAGVGGLGEAGTPLAVIAGIVGAIILAIILFRKWKAGESTATGSAAAGRGAIDFDAIRTREQLVRAFDAVSIDKIGDEVRSWNHRVIAGELGAPATGLAGLYERARYAPNDENLSTGEYDDARRDFRTIAGGNA